MSTIEGLRPLRATLTVLVAGLLAMAIAPLAGAQDATPPGTPSELEGLNVAVTNVDGDEVGVLSFVQVEGLEAVRITGELSGLEPGEHGFHIHEFGICDPSGDEPFSTAGGHFNPTGAMHGAGPMAAGTPVSATPADHAMGHAGDLGNITVGDDGVVAVDLTTDRVTLTPGAENSLDDADGSAIVVHQGPDDLMTDPSGESGPRVACGVIFAGSGATPVAIGGR